MFFAFLSQCFERREGRAMKSISQAETTFLGYLKAVLQRANSQNSFVRHGKSNQESPLAVLFVYTKWNQSFSHFHQLASNLSRTINLFLCIVTDWNSSRLLSECTNFSSSSSMRPRPLRNRKISAWKDHRWQLSLCWSPRSNNSIFVGVTAAWMCVSCLLQFSFLLTRDENSFSGGANFYGRAPTVPTL